MGKKFFGRINKNNIYYEECNCDERCKNYPDYSPDGDYSYYCSICNKGYFIKYKEEDKEVNDIINIDDFEKSDEFKKCCDIYNKSVELEMQKNKVKQEIKLYDDIDNGYYYPYDTFTHKAGYVQDRIYKIKKFRECKKKLEEITQEIENIENENKEFIDKIFYKIKNNINKLI